MLNEKNGINKIRKFAGQRFRTIDSLDMGSLIRLIILISIVNRMDSFTLIGVAGLFHHKKRAKKEINDIDECFNKIFKTFFEWYSELDHYLINNY